MFKKNWALKFFVFVLGKFKHNTIVTFIKYEYILLKDFFKYFYLRRCYMFKCIFLTFITSHDSLFMCLSIFLPFMMLINYLTLFLFRS
jgi:hypothetical protein